jgi:GntR family transcriptional regulator
MMVLDQGPTPLYFQLKNALRSKILSNEWKGNERLPSEAELCVEYGVSRVTVRQALSELMKDGLIYRDRGRGTFVTVGAGLKRLSLKGSIENLITAGEGTRIKVLSYKEIPLSPHIAKILQLGMNQEIFQLELVRFFPKGPFGYSFLYFPPSLGKMISPKELSETTEIITFVEGKMKTKVNRANQTIDVGLADKRVAEKLSIKPKTPLLIIKRDYYSRDGSPMFVSITHFRPDLYKYRIELTRT